jgi:hypothetical protein
MASISITAEAEVEIARLLAELGKYEKPAVAVLMVHWSARSMENHRGAQGEVNWEQIEASHWSADVAGWTDTPELKLAENTLLIQGFQVLLDPKAKEASGVLTVSAAAGELIVRLEPP